MSIQRFNKGVKRDRSKMGNTSDCLYYLMNGRLLSDGEQSNMNISNVKGNEVTNIDENYEGFETYDRADFQIVGHQLIRDNIVLFYSEDSALSYELSKDKVNIIDLLVKVGEYNYKRYELWRGVGLNLPIDVEMDIVSNYETDYLQKIYWVDYNNPLRYLDISPKTDTDDYSDIASKAVSDMNVVRDVSLNKPEFMAMGGGSLRTGSIQYAYRTYIINGPTSRYSQASDLIRITSEQELSGASNRYGGEEVDVNSGKSITIRITDFDNSFDKFELIAMLYTSNLEVPTIRTVAISDIPDSGFIDVIDDGLTNLGEITLEEFRAQPIIFSAKHMLSKDHILFAANIRYNNFNFQKEYREINNISDPTTEWDARAYRFTNTDFYIKPTIQFYDRDANSFEEYTEVDIPTIGKKNNCINRYNHQRDSLSMINGYKCRYTSSGERLGATGTNVEITFGIKTIRADDDGNIRYVGTNLEDEEGIGYSNYASPLNGGSYVGYKRGDTYRFAIVIQDPYGRESEAMWSCDLKMPEANELDSVPTYNKYTIPLSEEVGSEYGDMRDFATSFYISKLDVQIIDALGYNIKQGTYFNILYPKFKVSNLPAGYKYRVVRVLRTDNDKTVLAQGMIGGLSTIDNGANYSFNTHPSTTTSYGTDGGVSITGKNLYNQRTENTGAFELKGSKTLHEFITPYTNYNRKLKFREGDFIRLVGFYGTPDIGYWEDVRTGGFANYTLFNQISGGEDVQVIRKLRDAYPYIEYDANNTPLGTYLSFADIQESMITDADESHERARYELSGEVIIPYVFRHDGEGHASEKGSTMLLSLSNDLYNELYWPKANVEDNLIDDETRWLMADYRRDVAQYGGNTYIARTSMEYIPCTDVLKPDGNFTDVFNGDTYINFFVYMRTVWAVKGERNWGYDSIQEILYIPVESDFNLDFQGSSFIFNKMNDKRHSYLLHERPGEYSENPNNLDLIKLLQTEYFYKYNEAYSKIDTSNKYYAISKQPETSDEFDTRLIHSETKANGEEIDSWSIFKVLNYVDADNAYGEITNLSELRSYVFVFQDRAVGLAEINQKAIAPSTTGEIVLGTGGILAGIDYKIGSTVVGCPIGSDVVKSIDFLYWYDKNKKGLYTFTDKVFSLSDMKENSSWFINNTNINTKIRGMYDRENKEVVITVDTRDEFGNPINKPYGLLEEFTMGDMTHKLSTNTKYLDMNVNNFININAFRYQVVFIDQFNVYLTKITQGDPVLEEVDLSNYSDFGGVFTIVYSEIVGEFVGFRSFIPSRYINALNTYITTRNNKTLYSHNIGEFNSYYGIYYDMEFDLVCNGNDPRGKKFDGIEYMSEVSINRKTYSEKGNGGIFEIDSAEFDMYGVENETLSVIRSYSNDQIGDEVWLYPEINYKGRPISDNEPFYLKDIVDSSDYGIRGISSNPGIFFNGMDLTHIYNIRKAANKWRTAIPRSYTGREDELGRKIYEHIRSPFCRLKLRYINDGGKKRIIVHPIKVMYSIQVND